MSSSDGSSFLGAKGAFRGGTTALRRVLDQLCHLCYSEAVSLEYIILGLLRSPQSGYDLKAQFEAGAAHFWAAESSQIYATLKRMRARGWLSVRAVASDKGPPRRVYQRTPKGRRALQAWLAGNPQFGDERYAFVAQVYFLGELEDPQSRIELLKRLRSNLTERLSALRAVEEAWSSKSADYPDRLSDDDFFPSLTLQLGLRSAAARLEWCDAIIRRTEARENKGQRR